MLLQQDNSDKELWHVVVVIMQEKKQELKYSLDWLPESIW